MARIAGVDIPREKRLEISLTYIFGIGRTSARTGRARRPASQPTPACATSPTRRSPSSARSSTRTSRSRVTCAATCRRTSSARSRSAAYQGIRHRRGLPVHGQRTRTNARTRKGPKKTVAGKKRAAQEVMSESRASSGKAGTGGRRPSAASARTSPTASRTSSRRSTTRSSRSPTSRGTRSRGRRPATSASRARASARRSPRSSRPRPRRAGRWSTACARSTSW